MSEWLILDLPVNEQIEMKSFVGTVTKITEINPNDYFWLEFGNMIEDGENAYCMNQSLSVLAVSRRTSNSFTPC